MKQSSSRFLIPEPAGIVTRAVVALVLTILGIWMFVLTAHGITRGSLLWVHYFGTKEFVYRAANPVDFWAGVITYLVIACFCLYAARAEILYAWRKYKRTHSI